MLIDLLNQSIMEMKEIYELEKSANDVQKQEKSDRIYATAVNESYLITQAVSKCMSQLDFSVSTDTKNRMEELLRSASDAVSRGMVQETTSNHIQKEVAGIKKTILQEWSEHYHKIADQKIGMLQTVRGIVLEREKVDYASNKIKMGALWEFKQDNLDKMEKGLQEADDIIENLGFGETGEEIIDFLKKVAAGNASVHDLTSTVLNWLTDKNMTTKFAVSFR